MILFNNHSAIVRLLLALLKQLKPLAQVSNRSLVLIVPRLLLSQSVELVSATDVDWVVAVGHVRFLQRSAYHMC